MVEKLRVRRSIQVMWQEYLDGHKKPIIDLIRAWHGIQELSKKDPDNEHSFFKIGGFHGEPFRGAGYANGSWWGGWCNHGNILFPTWHRAYCLRIENALRSIRSCEDVTLPFWDETGEETKRNGVPAIFLQEKFTLDGVSIDNPLYSYEFPEGITDNVDADGLYTKARKYKTVRYPYSGLVGGENAIQITEMHNAQFTPAEAADNLNSNVQNWLNLEIEVTQKNSKGVDVTTTIPTGTRKKFEECLKAPNYTVFSNTTSAGAWNDRHEVQDHVIPLESPHNDMHLAVGGFDVPGQGDFSHVSGANGDMGENDTAGLDPIFHIHHANIDRYFWLWQQQHGQCEKLEIEQSLQEFPGTNSVDSQGPTPGMAGGTWLNLDTALRPFTKSDGTDMRSVDVVNIKTQLGYTYEIVPPPARTAPPKFATAAVRISGVNKNSISGSHQLAVYAPGPTGPQLIGLESVLSRWHTSGCQNCQANSDAVRYFPIPAVFADNAIARVVTHAEAGKPVPRFTSGRPSKGLGEKIPKSHVIREGEKFADVRGKSKVVSVVSERRK